MQRLLNTSSFFPTTSTELGQKTIRSESLQALLHYVEWDRIVTLAGAKADWGLRYRIYCSGSSSRHFLRFLSNNFKKQSRNLCFTPLLFCMTHNALPTKWIFIKESVRWSRIHYYDVAFFIRKWPQQKQFSPTFRNIVFCEAKASKGKKNDILEN